MVVRVGKETWASIVCASTPPLVCTPAARLCLCHLLSNHQCCIEALLVCWPCAWPLSMAGSACLCSSVMRASVSFFECIFMHATACCRACTFMCTCHLYTLSCFVFIWLTSIACFVCWGSLRHLIPRLCDLRSGQAWSARASKLPVLAGLPVFNMVSVLVFGARLAACLLTLRLVRHGCVLCRIGPWADLQPSDSFVS